MAPKTTTTMARIKTSSPNPISMRIFVRPTILPFSGGRTRERSDRGARPSATAGSAATRPDLRSTGPRFEQPAVRFDEGMVDRQVVAIVLSVAARLR